MSRTNHARTHRLNRSPAITVAGHEVLAKWLDTLTWLERRALLQGLCTALAADNPRFNAQKFVERVAGTSKENANG